MEIKNKDGKVIKEIEGDTLSYADLTGANLIGADLRCADLRYANLRNADLIGANLTGANLIGANLTGAKTSCCIVNFSPNEYEQAKQFIEGLKK